MCMVNWTLTIFVLRCFLSYYSTYKNYLLVNIIYKHNMIVLSTVYVHTVFVHIKQFEKLIVFNCHFMIILNIVVDPMNSK